MTNFKKEEIGKISEVGKNYENGKAFLHDLLGLTSCEISVSAMPAGVKFPFNHKHKQNEEVYIFLKVFLLIQTLPEINFGIIFYSNLSKFFQISL